MPETPTRRKVMISSTSLDLPEHRKQVIEACLRMDCTPLAMETLTAAEQKQAQTYRIQFSRGQGSPRGYTIDREN